MTVHQYCIPLEQPVEWVQALAGIEHSFGHTWENCFAMHLTTGHRTYLYCFEAAGVRIVCPIAEREYEGHLDVMKPFGFSGFVGNAGHPELHSRWKEFARQQGYVCGYLGLNPVFDCSGNFDPAEVFQYDTVHLLDLTRDLDELWSNLSTNRRRQLKDWNSILASLTVEKDELAAFFHAHHREFFCRKGAEQFYSFSQDTLSFLFSLDNVLLVGARNGDIIEAVSVFAHTPYAGEYLFNISLPGGKDHTAALIWYGVNELKSRQIPSLNLGGGGGGVGESKRRYGGRTFPLRCIKQVYAPKVYERLCQLAGACPDSASGYFPAYRKPA